MVEQSRTSGLPWNQCSLFPLRPRAPSNSNPVETLFPWKFSSEGTSRQVVHSQRTRCGGAASFASPICDMHVQSENESGKRCMKTRYLPGVSRTDKDKKRTCQVRCGHQRNSSSAVSNSHCFFEAVMLFHLQEVITLAQRRTNLASKVKPWNMRTFHSSQRCCEQYLDASQKVWVTCSGDDKSLPIICPRPLTKLH